MQRRHLAPGKKDIGSGVLCLADGFVRCEMRFESLLRRMKMGYLRVVGLGLVIGTP